MCTCAYECARANMCVDIECCGCNTQLQILKQIRDTGGGGVGGGGRFGVSLLAPPSSQRHGRAGAAVVGG